MSRSRVWLDQLTSGPTIESDTVRRAVTRGTRGDPFAAVFDSLLQDLTQEYAEEVGALDKERGLVTAELNEMRRNCVESILDFLTQALPGGVNEAALEVYRAHRVFFKNIGLEVTADGLIPHAVTDRVEDR